MSRQRHQSNRAVLWLACGLYLAACALPATKRWISTGLAAASEKLYVTEYGIECLGLGWWSGVFAWLANPLAFISVGLLVFRRYTGAAAFGIASLIVSALYVIDPPGEPGHPDLPQIGAWLWLGSLIALTAAAVSQCLHTPEGNHDHKRE